MAYENWRGDRAYITDRIFDGFQSGCVPVYLGDEHISEWIPGEAFIDARHFSDPRQLLGHLHSMDEGEWQDKITAGKNFLAGARAREFDDKAFAENMTAALRAVTRT